MARLLLKSILVVASIVALLSFDVPVGWQKKGTAPKKYDMGIDQSVHRKGRSVYTIKSIEAVPENRFGTLLNIAPQEKYLGRRVRLSGYMKSENVVGWASFWMSVTGESKYKSVSFDNMVNRPVKASTDWQKYDIVLDVPINASSISYGALVCGTGQIWFDNVQLEIVDKTVPITDMNLLSPNGERNTTEVYPDK